MRPTPPPQIFQWPFAAHLQSLLREHNDARLNRREFLTRATALGLAASQAYLLLGLPASAAQTVPENRVAGGILRCAMEVKPLKDPRLSDWPQIANIYRGWLEYLVRYNSDGSFEGQLLRGWEANADATRYMLDIRPGVRWNNGDAFTVNDVMRNFARWCDARVAGNSMAGRLLGLIDPQTKQLRDGALVQRGPERLEVHLSQSDASFVANLSDYPAALVHETYDPAADYKENLIGTGPWLLREYQAGKRAVLVRNDDHDWWGGKVALAEIHYIDAGSDPAATIELAKRDEIDCTFETTNEFIPALARLHWGRLEQETAATIVMRMNKITGPEFRSKALRQAIQRAVDPAIVLEIGYGGHGQLGENHHACPLHPEYAALPPQEIAPQALRPALQAEGLEAHAFELVSLDDGWQSASADAVAVQLRDAGMNITRKLLPRDEFRQNWREYPFSATNWNHRPLAVQNMALAYRTGAAWNETGMSNPAFDAALDRALALSDAQARREVMAELQQILRDEGHIIQPYWRRIFRHRRPGVVIDIHPSFEHHHDKWAITAAAPQAQNPAQK